ncbi:MAG TPA: hypothetical protein PK765_06755 [bacterium]|mgnify:CR=1 FL=1|nr:hypothetical protein [bacterium]
MLIGGLFWAMCDSTGSRYSNHYFSRDDGERACPADYRLPTVAEWTAAYREKLSGESESDENRWKYLTKLATDLSLSARGRLWIDRHMSVVANTFSLKEPEPIEIDYGDIPERYRSDAGEPTIVYSYGEYQYLAADGFMGLSYRYDEENPTSSATLSRYPEDADTATLSHILMSVRCVRK